MNGLFDGRYWRAGRIGGVPILLHWTIPIGAVIFGWFRFVPGFWLGFFLVLLVHELGHAFLVKRRGLYNHEIRIHGVGGLSIHEEGSFYDKSIIAWGGVLAQFFVLYVPTKLATLLLPIPPNIYLLQLLGAFLHINLFLIAINLIPLAPLDGALAWQFPKLWWARRKGSATRRKKKKKKKQKKARRQRQADEPPLRAIDGAKAEATAKEIARRALEDARRR